MNDFDNIPIWDACKYYWFHGQIVKYQDKIYQVCGYAIDIHVGKVPWKPEIGVPPSCLRGWKLFDLNKYIKD